jgi:hypothetical protein
MNTLVNTAYWPNLNYLQTVLNAESICIEQYDHYDKQSFRNRCEILSANGLLRLSIPVKKISGTKMLVKDVEISYQEKWQRQHWQAIISAYKNSPYFEYFEDDLKQFYTQEFQFLVAYNTTQLQFLLKALRINKTITLSNQYDVMPIHTNDYRYLIDVKKQESILQLLPYHQTFSEKFSFIPNLSSLDILFNLGLKSKTYLAPAT